MEGEGGVRKRDGGLGLVQLACGTNERGEKKKDVKKTQKFAVASNYRYQECPKR